MNTGKTISLAKAKADFGAVLRLAHRFDCVRVMQGRRLVGAVISPVRLQRVTNVEPLPKAVLERIYAQRDAERLPDEPQRTSGAELARRLARLKPQPRVANAVAKAIGAIGK